MNYGIKRNELYHWGILGQKWGIRRFQNPDGSLTDEGRKRYLKLYSKKPDNIKNQQLIKASAKEMYQLYEKELANKRIFERFDEQDKQYDKIKSKIYSNKWFLICFLNMNFLFSSTLNLLI